MDYLFCPLCSFIAFAASSVSTVSLHLYDIGDMRSRRDYDPDENKAKVSYKLYLHHSLQAARMQLIMKRKKIAGYIIPLNSSVATTY